jgi:hypothetical protein
MFEFLMKRLKVIDWQYGPITMSTFNLEGIEINYPVLERYEIDELKHFVVSVEDFRKKFGHTTNEVEKYADIKRENWSSQVSNFDETERQKGYFLMTQKFYGVYRNMFWQKKTYN